MKLTLLLAGFASAAAGMAAHAEAVKITNIGHGYYAAALYVAKQEKMFEKHGLEPEISFVQGGALALQTVLTKQVDVGVLSYEHVLTSAVQGKQIVAFFNISNRPLNNIIASSKLAAGAEQLSLPEKIRRLKGQRIGLPSAGGSGEKMLIALTKRENLKLPGDITTAYLGSEPGSYVAAFQRNLIDAALPVEPAGVMAQQAGSGQIFLNLMTGDVPEFRDLLFMALTAHPDTIKGKPELLRKVALAFSEAVKLLKTDPQRGKALMAREYPAMTAEVNAKAYDTVSQIWPLDPRMTEQQARATFSYLQPEGPFKVDFAQTFTNEFLPK
ncbi:MAG: ABC transporter substrate-binding protein [Betaproteobacteria bacterium]|nr:ABC transporter substrate-binding protein [Betaproteobacteria bacterium]